jgi:hypothetical protein
MSNPTGDFKCITVASGPFTSTFDYLDSIIEAELTPHRESQGEDVTSLLLNVRSILQAYMEVRECMRAKCSTLNTFRDIFMLCGMEWKMLKRCVLEYIREEKEGTGMAYRGRVDWVPDPELDSDEDKSM